MDVLRDLPVGEERGEYDTRIMSLPRRFSGLGIFGHVETLKAARVASQASSRQMLIDRKYITEASIADLAAQQTRDGVADENNPYLRDGATPTLAEEEMGQAVKPVS